MGFGLQIVKVMVLNPGYTGFYDLTPEEQNHFYRLVMVLTMEEEHAKGICLCEAENQHG